LRRGKFYALLRSELKARRLPCKLRHAVFERNAVAVGAALLLENRT